MHKTVKAHIRRLSALTYQVPASAPEFNKAQLLLVYLDAMPAWQEVPPCLSVSLALCLALCLSVSRCLSLFLSH